MNLWKLEEVFVHKRTKYNNLSHFLYRCYKVRYPCMYLQPIFLNAQRPVLVIFLQRIL
jgi:hypothetical protein